MKLNHIVCENAGKRAKESGKTLKLADGQGLYLQAQPSGARYWRFKYRFAGKEKLLALGVYPEVSLKEARDKRDSARKLLADNQDPSTVKKEKRLQAFTESENTFEKVAREWFEQQKVILTPKHAAALVARFERDVFPHIGCLPIKDIKPTYVLEVCRKVEARKAYDVARRIKQTCGQIFRYSIATGRAERDPTQDLKDALRPYKLEHYAALDVKELPAFLAVLEKNEARLYQDTRLAIKLLMLTFVRTSELINAKWSEIDLDDATWIIPAKRMKMRRDHIVPLSRQAVAILRELKTHNGHREWVFPNQARPRKSMSNATITRALMRKPWQSDALCRIATGAGLGVRQHYMDKDEIVFDATRPIIFNGIEGIVERLDLMSRCLVINLPTISGERRRTDEEIDQHITEAMPRILGGLFNALSAALKNLPHTKPERLPRMADFAKRVLSVEKEIGWEEGTFLPYYESLAIVAAKEAMEGDDILQAILRHMNMKSTWEGTALQLHRIIVGRTPYEKRKFVPKSNKIPIKRLIPALRNYGIELVQKRTSDKRLIILENRNEGFIVDVDMTSNVLTLDEAKKIIL